MPVAKRSNLLRRSALRQMFYKTRPTGQLAPSRFDLSTGCSRAYSLAFASASAPRFTQDATFFIQDGSNLLRSSYWRDSLNEFDFPPKTVSLYLVSWRFQTKRDWERFFSLTVSHAVKTLNRSCGSVVSWHHEDGSYCVMISEDLEIARGPFPNRTSRPIGWI